MMMMTTLNVILTSSIREPVHDDHLHDAPTHSVARFNFTCHIVDVGSKVLETLERAQRIHARPMRPTLPGLDESQFRHARDSATAYHVDARAFSDLIDSLVADLDLLDSYTLVVMNPRRANMGAKYGYREGFSDDEVEFLRGKRTELLREAKRRGGVRARAPAPTAATAIDVHRVLSVRGEAEVWKRRQAQSRRRVGEKGG